MTPSLRVAVASSKGGTGKSTVTSAVGSILARSGLSVLVVDLDPQGDATFALGGDPARDGAAEFLLGEGPAPEVVAENLAVLAGGPRLESIDVERLDPEALLDGLAGFDFDAVVVDSPPGAPYLRRFALVAASVALIPCSAHPFSVRAAGEILDEIEGRRERGRPVAERAALVANAIDRRRSLDATFADEMAGLYGDRAEVLEVRQDAALALATASREPIAYSESLRGNTRGLADLEALVRWVQGEAEREEGA